MPARVSTAQKNDRNIPEISGDFSGRFTGYSKEFS
jgi:hypothetical protein